MAATLHGGPHPCWACTSVSCVRGSCIPGLAPRTCLLIKFLNEEKQRRGNPHSSNEGGKEKETTSFVNLLCTSVILKNFESCGLVHEIRIVSVHSNGKRRCATVTMTGPSRPWCMMTGRKNSGITTSWGARMGGTRRAAAAHRVLRRGWWCALTTSKKKQRASPLVCCCPLWIPRRRERRDKFCGTSRWR